MRKLIALLGLGLLIACSDAHQETHEKVAAQLPDKSAGIVISNAIVRPPFPGRDITAGYMHIANGGGADRLIGAESDIADRVEIHTHKLEDGIMKMRKVDDVEIPAEDVVLFAPGGLHLMMFGVSLDEGQTDAALTLKFENAPDLTIIADITNPAIDGPVKSGNHDGH